jgi:hypothetical protein
VVLGVAFFGGVGWGRDAAEAVERHTGGPPLMAWWLGAQPFRGREEEGEGAGRRRVSAWRTRGEGEEARGGEGVPGIGRPARPGRWSEWLELEDGPDRWAPPVSGVCERERLAGWLS